MYMRDELVSPHTAGIAKMYENNKRDEAFHASSLCVLHTLIIVRAESVINGITQTVTDYSDHG